MHSRPRPRAGELVKVVFELPPDDWHGLGAESMWAEIVGPGKYRLANVPFAAYGFSFDDVVRAEEKEGRLLVVAPIARGGHSTFRVFLAEGVTPEGEPFLAVWRPLEALGCELERATERLFAIDVPGRAPLPRVVDLLENGKAAGIWDCEEGHLHEAH
jgi:hypothetical protein